MKKAFLGFALGVVLITLIGLGIILTQRINDPNSMAIETNRVIPASAKADVPKSDLTRAPDPAKEPPRPQPTRSPQKVTPPDSELRLIQTVSNEGAYKTSDVLEVRYEIERISGKETVHALGIETTLPRGFAFAGMGDGTWPDLYPKEGHSSPHQFAWIKVPQFPATFSYYIKAPEALRPAPQALASVAIFRTTAGELRSNPATSTLTPAGATDALEKKLAAPLQNMKKPDPPTVVQAPRERVALNRTIANTYTPGETMTIQLHLSYPDALPIQNFAVTEQIPKGWIFQKMTPTENGPTFSPKPGKEDLLTFVWDSPPTFPIELTYSLDIPATEKGTHEITGQAIYHQDNEEVRGTRIVSTLNQP